MCEKAAYLDYSRLGGGGCHALLPVVNAHTHGRGGGAKGHPRTGVGHVAYRLHS